MFRLSVNALLVALGAWATTSALAHDISDEQHCTDFNEEFFGGVSEFGYQLEHTIAFSRWLTLGTPVASSVTSGNLYFGAAKIVECSSGDMPYAENPSFCLVPRYQGVEGLENFPPKELWKATIQQNEDRKAYLEVCPISYSDTEIKLFQIRQAKALKQEIPNALEAASTLFLRENTEACFDEFRAKGNIEEKEIELRERGEKKCDPEEQIDGQLTAQAFLCEVGALEVSIDFHIKAEGHYRRLCRQKYWDSDDFQRYLTIFESISE